MPGIAVLIPALDEEEALLRLLPAIPPEVGVMVVVDNGSRDRTREVARGGGATLLEEPRRGYGSACLRGIRYLAALPHPPEVLVFLDADHPAPEQLRTLVEPIEAGEADLVLGVRVPPAGSGSQVLPHARVGNRVVLGLLRLLFGARFADLAPFRAIRFDRLLELEMDDRDWGWTLQMQIRAVRHGLVVREIPLPHQGRKAGRSKISGSLSVSARVGATMFYTLGREWLRGRPKR